MFIYDELSHKLTSAGVSCHIGGSPMDNFVYADDLALLAPTARQLNKIPRPTSCVVFALYSGEFRFEGFM